MIIEFGRNTHYLQPQVPQVYYYYNSDTLTLYVNFIIPKGKDVLMLYPDHFPEQCPPDTAHEANGDVYRFIKTPKPEASDFTSHWEESPGKDWGDKGCLVCGLSVYIDFAEVATIWRTNPHWRRHFVAKGTLSPDWGEMLHTGKRSHHTWWTPTERRPWTVFETIEVPGE